MKNYEDTKCAWGYITVCNKCVEKVRGKPSFKHVKFEREIKGLPTMEKCEICGRKEA